MIRKNSLYSRMSSTSKAQLLFTNQDPTKLEFHTLNKKLSKEYTFKIIVMEDYDSSMQALLGYQSLFVSLFCMVVCCSCGLKLLRACLIRCRRITCFRRNNNRRGRRDPDDSDEREPRSYIARSGQVPEISEMQVRNNRVYNDEQARR